MESLTVAQQKLQEQLSNLLSKKNTKIKEIEKRKEVLTTYNESEVVKEKKENKLEKIYSKLIDLSGNSLNSINYYREQINKAEQIYYRELNKYELKKERALEKAKALYDEAVRNAESSFEMNNKILEEKRDSNIKDYENHILRISEKLYDKSSGLVEKTNSIVNNKSVDEDSDKLLIKLKLELKDIEKEIEEKNTLFRKSAEESLRYANKLIEERKREARQKELDIENKKIEEALLLKQQEQEQEKLHQEKLRENKQKNPELFMTQDEVRLRRRAFYNKKKQFLEQHKSILNNYSIGEESVDDYLMKHDLETLIELESEENIKKFCDSIYSFYKKKILFEEKINKTLSELQVNIYNQLRQLSNNDNIYIDFFNITNLDKQKKFLNKYEKEYNFRFSED